MKFEKLEIKMNKKFDMTTLTRKLEAVETQGLWGHPDRCAVIGGRWIDLYFFVRQIWCLCGDVSKLNYGLINFSDRRL